MSGNEGFRRLPISEEPEPDAEEQARWRQLSVELAAREAIVPLFDHPLWGHFEDYLAAEERRAIENLIRDDSRSDERRGRIRALRELRAMPDRVREEIHSLRERLADENEGEGSDG